MRRFATLVAGAFLVQLAWIATVPPFWGLDEVDHAYRAAEVSAGQWSPSHEQSPDGSHELVTVPASLVAAGRAVCEAQWAATTSEKCTPAGEAGSGRIRVPSSAARYNPLFYAVIGVPSSGFSGVTSLYVMRVVAALACALLFAWAVQIASGWGRTSWPLVAMLVAVTPTWWYSTAIAAPNGIEMAGGLLLWSSLLALVRRRSDGRSWQHLLLPATVGAVVLATVRSLGPLWLLLIVATVAVASPRLAAGWRRPTSSMLTALVVALLAVAAGVAWTLLAGTNQVPAAADAARSPWIPAGLTDPSLADLGGFVVFWVFQSIAVFPDLKMFAPGPVYLVVGLMWLALLGAGWRLARPRTRLAVAGAVVVATAVPVTVTLLTYSSLGVAWQGRYALPYTVGVALVCGYALDRRARCAPWVPWLAAGALALSAVLSQLRVLDRRLEDRVPTVDHLSVHPALIATATTLGIALVTWAATRAVPAGPVSPAPSAQPAPSRSHPSGRTTDTSPTRRSLPGARSPRPRGGPRDRSARTPRSAGSAGRRTW